MSTIDKIKRQMVYMKMVGFEDERLPDEVTKEDLTNIVDLIQSLELTNEDITNRIEGIDLALNRHKGELDEVEQLRMNGIRFVLVNILETIHKVDKEIDRRVSPIEVMNKIPEVLIPDKTAYDMVQVWRLEGVSIEEIKNRLWKDTVKSARNGW